LDEFTIEFFETKKRDWFPSFLIWLTLNFVYYLIFVL
jgi:hypothetical protein